MPPRRVIAAACALALSFALAGCGDEAADEPGAVSADEAKALEDAASMLDERALPPEAPPSDAPDAAPAEMTGDASPAAP